MFRNLFKPDSDLMIFMSQVTDCIFLSLFFLIGCIPLLTVSTSFAALYDSAFRGIRRTDKHSWQRFLEVYKDNWKGGILPSILLIALLYGLIAGMVAFWNAAVAGSASWMLFSAVMLLAIVILGIVSVMAPMLSRFDNPLPALLKNTLLLSLANMPRTLALGILNAAAGFACVQWVFPVFFVPALAAFLASFLIEPMFKPYMPQEEDTDIAEDEEDAEE